ncbi:hypothetical protein NG895_15810 [Aeoliella sp. ICT_H6.2]|uniref:SCP domain-containing protein n=1 Tax=Aeoliella straminimaris TaxID=2954799 RepID=A0A9X2FHY4_9BACT|nr:CAP domain-containing protein [Aeoliella straminimaris]MCO6045376.1 hypothetical protein [Aeoliella straminimaris]
MFAYPVHAQTLWMEGAENGTAYLRDGTSASYSLIQSDVVASGENAFHLANPSFESNWFEIDEEISVLPGTQLFFLSRLSWATDSQVARVQLSAEGGSTWPSTIYSQAGDWTAGEGSFALRQVDLSSYAHQEIKLRFVYDYLGGSAYTNNETAVGWRVDDIQVGAEFEKIQYSVGNPSAEEQLYLEFINRSRADAITEASRLANESDAATVAAYTTRGINPQHIIDQFETSVSDGYLPQFAQPLSFNSKLLLAADLHTEDMYLNGFQGHENSPNPPSPLEPGGGLATRLAKVGYVGGAAENVFAFAESVAHGHAAFDVDWGDTVNPDFGYYNPDFTGQGMQNGAGHRANIHNDSFKEIGVGVVDMLSGGTSVGPQIVTQDFGDPGNVAFVTGVVYEDINGNNFYDLGEGRPGVRVDIDESPYYAISSDSGAYSIPINENGFYSVEFTGGGFASFSAPAQIIGGRSYKVDYIIPVLPGDYDDNGLVDLSDYEIWKHTFGSTTDLAADGNGDRVVDLADYTIWRNHLGRRESAGAATSAVPESPVSFTWAAFSLWAMHRLRRRGDT